MGIIENDEIQSFLASLDSQNAGPSAKFKQQLSQKLFDPKNTKNIYIGSIFTMLKQKSILFSCSYALSLAIIILGGIFYAKYQGSDSSISKNSYAGILTEIAKHNALFSYAPTAAPVAAASDSTGEKTTLEKQLYPIGTDGSYSYLYTKTTTKRGPKECQLFIQNEGTDSSYYYTGSSNDIYSKNVSYNSDSQLTNYTLSTPEAIYTYVGGTYAIKTLQVQYDKTPMEVSDSSESSGSSGVETDSSKIIAERVSDGITQENILSLFGDVADISETTIDGLEYYIVKSEYQGNCSDQYEARDLIGYSTIPGIPQNDNPQTLPNTIVTRIFVRKDNYQTVKAEQYLASIAPENLISTIQTETIQSNVSFNSIKDIFTFEFDVTIKAVPAYDDQEIQREKERTVTNIGKLLKSKSLGILFPQGTYAMLSVYCQNASFDSNIFFSLFTSRDYYPQGSRGEDMYENVLKSYQISSDSYIEPILSMSFQNSSEVNSQMDIRIYENSDDSSKFLSLYGTSASQNETTITLNNDTVTATKFSFNNENVIQPSDTPVSSNGEVSTDAKPPVSGDGNNANSIATHVYLFTYHNYQYLIQSLNSANSLSFILKSPQVSNEYSEIIENITSALNNNNSSKGGIPVPLPAEETTFSPDYQK